jgi:MFS family permease
MLLVVAPAVWGLARNAPADVGQSPDGTAGEAVSARPSAALSEALTSRDFWLPTIGFVTCGYTLYLVAIHLPRFAEDLGGGLALGGTLLGLAAAASAIAMWVCGQASQRWGARRPLVALYLIRAVGLGLFATAHSVSDLYVAAIVYGVASMPIIPLVTRMIGDRFGANAMGSILGSTWLLHQLFAGAGVFLGGYLRSSTGSYRVAFWSGVGLLVAGAVVTAWGGRREKVRPVGTPAVEPVGA